MTSTRFYHDQYHSLAGFRKEYVEKSGQPPSSTDPCIGGGKYGNSKLNS